MRYTRKAYTNNPWFYPAADNIEAEHEPHFKYLYLMVLLLYAFQF